jgi:hypothetical protein
MSGGHPDCKTCRVLDERDGQRIAARQGIPEKEPVKRRPKAKTRVAPKLYFVEKADRRKDKRPDRRRRPRGGRRAADPTREEREDRINTIVEYTKRKADEDS